MISQMAITACFTDIERGFIQDSQRVQFTISENHLMSINMIFMELYPCFIPNIRNLPLKSFLRFIRPYFLGSSIIHDKTKFRNDIFIFISKQFITLLTMGNTISIKSPIQCFTRWTYLIIISRPSITRQRPNIPAFIKMSICNHFRLRCIFRNGSKQITAQFQIPSRMVIRTI